MNRLMHKINEYKGWEKYVEQISLRSVAYATFSRIECKIFCDKECGLFWWRKTKKVSVSFEIDEACSYEFAYTANEKQIYLDRTRALAQKWKQELIDYVNKDGSDSRKEMIELAEMALISSDPYVKDQFITKWLASVKPINTN